MTSKKNVVSTTSTRRFNVVCLLGYIVIEGLYMYFDMIAQHLDLPKVDPKTQYVAPHEKSNNGIVVQYRDHGF